MSHGHQLASILDAVRLKADLRVRLYETLPNNWMPELERFLEALAKREPADGHVVIAILADIATT